MLFAIVINYIWVTLVDQNNERMTLKRISIGILLLAISIPIFLGIRLLYNHAILEKHLNHETQKIYLGLADTSNQELPTEVKQIFSAGRTKNVVVVGPDGKVRIEYWRLPERLQAKPETIEIVVLVLPVKPVYERGSPN